MANHPDVGFGHAQKAGYIRAGLLVIERHDDHGPFPFFEILDTASELFVVQMRHGRLNRHEIRGKRFKQSFSSPSPAAQIHHHHPACAEHEGRELLRLAQATRPQSFKGRNEHLLRQVVRGVAIPQVTQAVEPNPGSHSAKQLGFGFAVVSGPDLPHQFGIVEFKVHQHT
jgi:hypothetical protein